MWKYLILLICSIPLVLVAYADARRLYDLSSNPVVVPPPPPESIDVDLRKAKELAIKATAMPDWAAPALLGAPGPPSNPTSPAPAPGTLAEVVLTHAGDLIEARRQAKEARDAREDRGARVTNLLKRLFDDSGQFLAASPIDKLREESAEYGKLTVKDPALASSAKAALAWADLQEKYPRRKLAAIYDDLESWSVTAPKSGVTSQNEINDAVKTLRDFLAECPASTPMFPWAKEQVSLWESAGKLLAALSSHRSDPPADQLKAIAALIDDPAPRRFTTIVRKVAGAICKDALPEEVLDADVIVVGNGNTADTVEREKVMIFFKNGTKKKLKDSSFTEYTLTRDQVEHLEIGPGKIRELSSDDNKPPLRGTSYSEAVNAFNLKRARVTEWTENSLDDLRNAIAPHRSTLETSASKSTGSTLPKRIDGLRSAVLLHPKLFGPISP